MVRTLEADWIDEASWFLAQTIDKLFIEGFRFTVEDAPELMKHFCFVGNTLYISCFEKPKFVLSYYCDSGRIRIQRINNLKAMIWGRQIKDYLQHKKQYTRRKKGE